MNNIIISNCCLTIDIHRKLNNCEYNNPLIGTIILDDFQYLELCKNIRRQDNVNEQIDFHKESDILIDYIKTNY